MPYHVVMKNNNITPFDFAVGVLTDFFEYSEEDATQKAMAVMWNDDVPQKIATYDDYDEAMQKVSDAMLFVKSNNDELQIYVEDLATKSG